MKLKNIVPWGRNLAEYKAMFLLTDSELTSKLLGCGDGPASFNAEVTTLGGNIISIDPIYQFTREQISSRIDEVAEEIMRQVRKKEDTFVWEAIKNPDALYVIRLAAMQNFMQDFEHGKEQGRYQFQMLPQLSFSDQQFDLALSSHFLLLYSEHLDLAFHISAITEMLRVANEVRIFPIITLEGEKSPHLESIMSSIQEMGYRTEILKTDYEFQKGGNEILRIVKEKIPKQVREFFI